MTEIITDEFPKPVDVDQVVLGITARRWLSYRRALDLSTTEILNDTTLQLVVACNEVTKPSRGGRDDLDRFLDMGFKDLSLFLGLIEEEDAQKSDEPRGAVEPGHGAPEFAGVGVAGGVDGPVEDSGSVVSGDGSQPG